MEKPLTHGSLFAGIGGFDEGFHRAGFKTLWQVEKEPFCIAVLKTHYPDAERYYDVLKCGHERKHKLRAVDVLTAGFPCQDLSVAGKRAGLEGARSGLFWEVVRILGELRPAWFVLENVPGLFSSGEGRDFAIVLNALDELGYGVAWRVLNSQFFGVAQRRRRVFIVGRFGKPCPAEILFESEGGGGDSKTGGEEWESLAGALTEGTGRVGSKGCDDGANIVIEQNTQCSTPNRPSLRSHGTPNYAVALSASAGHHGHSNPRGDGSDNLVTTHADYCGTLRAGAGAVKHESDERQLIVQQAISSKWPKGSSGPAGDEHHNLTVCGTLGNASGKRGWNVSAENAADGQLHVSAPSDSNGVRDFTGLPEGMDSARYRALGNAVTVQVAYWIAKRIAQIAGLGPTGVSQKAE